MRGVMRAMKLPAGIEIVKVVDRRSYWEAYFEIIEPDLEEGFRSILDWMNPERELFLLDYRRGDVEGGVVLKLMKEKFYLMKGGHGYSSNWKEVTPNKAIEELKDATQSNQGNGIYAQGYLSEKISHNERMQPDSVKPRS